MNPPAVKILRSTRRKRTIQARQVNGELFIYLPSGMSASEEKKWIDRMTKKFEQQQQRKEMNSDDVLSKRAQMLNKKFFDETLVFSIRFVTNQRTRFGSCTSVDRSIRISERITKMPRWVQDYVILHELAHLVYPDHSRSFWSKVNQYKYAERAKGYLIAVGMGSDEEPLEDR